MNHKHQRVRSALKSMAVSAVAMEMTRASTADWKGDYGQGSLAYFPAKERS